LAGGAEARPNTQDVDVAAVDLDADGEHNLVTSTEGEPLTEGAQDVSAWRNSESGTLTTVER